jgi:guanine nucleotide-binding protein subunit alpha
MVLIHGKGYSETERCRFKSCIFSNTVVSLKVILETMPELGITLEDDSNQDHVETIMLLPETYTHTHLSEDVAFALRELWKDRGVQACFARSREYQLNDSAGYYLDSVERFSDPNYIPTEQDVLRARVKTTGIQETTFQVQNLNYRMVDVGGQRSERKKWIHCFENVTTIIFMSAISEYDQTLIEDKAVVSHLSRD